MGCASDPGVVTTTAAARGEKLAGDPGFAESKFNSFSCTTCHGDGKRIVYDIADPRSGSVDIWAFDLPDGPPSRLTSDPAVDFYVACSPSGSDIVFASLRQGIPSLYRQNTSAPGSEQLLQKMPGPAIPSDWSPDGRSIVFSTFSPKTNWDIWTVPVDGGQPIPFAETAASTAAETAQPITLIFNWPLKLAAK